MLFAGVFECRFAAHYGLTSPKYLLPRSGFKVWSAEISDPARPARPAGRPDPLPPKHTTTESCLVGWWLFLVGCPQLVGRLVAWLHS